MHDGWIDAKSLIAVASDRGYKVSARSLELWRYRGLLPRGEQPAGRAAWVYPPESEGQLLRLLHWREKTRSLDMILTALWVEGFRIEMANARVSLRAFVDAWERELTRALDGADDVSTAIEALARKLASKRGKAAFPRVARMSADERVRACAYALAFAFNAEEEIARRKGDAVLLERMLGFRSGRGGGLATALPLDEDTLRLAGLRPPGQLRAMLDSATDDEFEFVRRLLHAVVVWLPVLIPQFVEHFGQKARPVGELMRKLIEDLPPEHYAFAATGMLASLHANGRPADELRRQLGAITPEAINLDLIGTLPTEERRRAFAQLPAPDQQQVAGELARRRTASRASQGGATRNSEADGEAPGGSAIVPSL
jgi:hypothetical protein